MVIVFDMDNTLCDETGSTTRPGIKNLLRRLIGDGHFLILWTNSPKNKAKSVLDNQGLQPYFTKIIAREDYYPDKIGIYKDIRKVNGDFLVDDDPKEIQYVQSIGRKGYQITPFYKDSDSDMEELDNFYKVISNSQGWIKRIIKAK